MKDMEVEDVKNSVPFVKVLKYYNVNKHIKQVPIYAWYRIGWRFYFLDLNFSQYTAADVIALRAYFASEDEMVSNLHKVMALLTKRKDKSVEYFNKLSEKIKDKVSVSKAYTIGVFFCKNYSETEVLKRLTKRMEKVNSELRKLQQKKSQGVISRLSTRWQRVIGRIGNLY
jgi:chaperonin cofactor prefoldin